MKRPQKSQISENWFQMPKHNECNTENLRSSMDYQNWTTLKRIGEIHDTYKSSSFRMQLRFRLERTFLASVLDFSLFRPLAQWYKIQTQASSVMRHKPPSLIFVCCCLASKRILKCSCQMQKTTTTTTTTTTVVYWEYGNQYGWSNLNQIVQDCLESISPKYPLLIHLTRSWFFNQNERFVL